MTDKIVFDTPPAPRKPIDPADRAAWMAAAMADDPPLSPAFLESFHGRPSTITTSTAREYFDVCRRDRAGQFQITGIEFGMTVTIRKKNGKQQKTRTSYGYTLHLFHPSGQTNLL